MDLSCISMMMAVRLRLSGKLFEADNHSDYVVTQYLLDMVAVRRTNEAHRIK